MSQSEPKLERNPGDPGPFVRPVEAVAAAETIVAGPRDLAVLAAAEAVREATIAFESARRAEDRARDAHDAAIEFTRDAGNALRRAEDDLRLAAGGYSRL